MNAAGSGRDGLRELPLWRLLVLLHDAEREAGANSSTVRVLARLVQDKLRVDSGDCREDVRDAN